MRLGGLCGSRGVYNAATHLMTKQLSFTVAYGVNPLQLADVALERANLTLESTKMVRIWPRSMNKF